jgi:hypothetical protein
MGFLATFSPPAESIDVYVVESDRFEAPAERCQGFSGPLPGVSGRTCVGCLPGDGGGSDPT